MTGSARGSWQQRVAALSPAQRNALAELLAREGRPTEPPRLVGFVVAAPSQEPSDEALRAFLAERLPDYMIPACFVALEQLPRTAAGKLDREALALAQGTPLASLAGGRATPPSITAPETVSDLEARLIAIWRDVLKVDEIGVDDDFFEIGGDSLLSIRAIARAGREGIRIAPEHFFERPTVRHLAAGANTREVEGADAAGARRATVAATGEAPLTPIQHWFLDAIPEHRDRWNQAYVLELSHPLAPEVLRDITRLLLARHEALRLRLVAREGRWHQAFPAIDDQVPFRVVSLVATDPVDDSARLAAEVDWEHASMRLTEGMLFRVVLFEGRDGWRRLLLVAHHLVVDGVSWSVLLDDLATLVTQAAMQRPLQLPAAPGAMSARAWAIALQDLAATAAVAATAAHWLSLPMDGGAMPIDEAPGGGGAVRDGREITTSHHDAAVVTVTLEVDETRDLLQEAPRRLDATAQSLLLTALLLAWRRWTATDVLWLDLEGHGRDVVGHDADAARTVGWFTTVFPVRLAIRGTDASAEPTTATVVHEVHRTLDALPMRGAAHGLLRHLAPDETIRARLAALPRPTLLFNYLGTHDLALPPASRLRVTEESGGRARSPQGARPYLLELNARVQGGQLIVSIEYARRVHSPGTIQQFAASLRESLAVVRRAVPRHIELAGLDDAGLQAVANLLGALDELDEELELDAP